MKASVVKVIGTGLVPARIILKEGPACRYRFRAVCNLAVSPKAGLRRVRFIPAGRDLLAVQFSQDRRLEVDLDLSAELARKSFFE